MQQENEFNELKAELKILEKYDAKDAKEQCEKKISEMKLELEKLQNKKFFCFECGQVFKMEERIYTQATGMGGDGPPYYVLWDTYICGNCGFFTWDETSRRIHATNYSSMDHKDPRFRGTMDGHPKFDRDSKAMQIKGPLAQVVSAADS